LCNNARMSEAARRARAQIQSYLDETGWSPTKLAQTAGLRASTITRFMNAPDFKSTPSSTTMVKLEEAVAAWRETRDQPDPGAAPLGPEKHGRFVDQPDQLAWLRLWDAIPAADRKRAVLVLRALAMDPSKFG
jgi:hypothetical protein